MTWCDKLASTPTVGFKFTPHFLGSENLLQRLAPILEPLTNEDNILYSVDQPIGPFQFSFSTEDGFFYAVDQTRIIVEFRHRLKISAVSGKPPTANLITEASPYSLLLDKIVQKALHAAEMINHGTSRKLIRIGVMSNTMAQEDELPPGIMRLGEYMVRPWKTTLDFYQIQIASEIQNNESFSDRCIHNIIKPENPKDLMSASFDWQRTFSEAKELTSAQLKTATDEAIESAVEYFEDVAEGSRFDEEIISNGE